MSPYFSESYGKAVIYWCPNCEAWFRTGTMSCCVMHSPGDCCHMGEIEVTAEEARHEGCRMIDEETP